MHNVGSRLIVKPSRMLGAVMGMHLVSGCQMNDAAGQSAIASVVASLGDFAASLARNLLAAWLL